MAAQSMPGLAALIEIPVHLEVPAGFTPWVRLVGADFWSISAAAHTR